MFFRALFAALMRRNRSLAMLALTMALGVSLATAMLNVMFDMGDKINQELKAYGANLTVMPKTSSILADLYNAGDTKANQYLPYDDVFRVKEIFWAHNIVDFAPFLDTNITIGSEDVPLIGTWFARHIDLPTGDSVDAGIVGLKSWWSVSGRLPDDNNSEVALGKRLANKLDLNIGAQLGDLLIVGIIDSGDSDSDKAFAPIEIVGKLTNNVGRISYISVSALTTPENELSRRAATDPRSLTTTEWDTWYCTAYISAIAYQLEEVLPQARVKQVMQVSQSEGAILSKIQLLMLLLTILSLLCSVLGISNLVTANVLERSTELALLKALGANDFQVSMAVFVEVLSATFAGGLVGYGLGLIFAQIVGQSVFGMWTEPKLVVIPLVVAMTLVVTLFGSLPASKMILKLHPAEVLHGR
ncbi:ABC transporter permease [Deferribacterales bacterium RsTz2092]|nr:ABC transporter permease [Deferribacterales bacterium]GHU84956.1 ABC transporter permease [Deferribacterales bacterium]